MDFLFGIDWSPQTAIRADQVGSSGAFGMRYRYLLGTLLITIIAMMRGRACGFVLGDLPGGICQSPDVRSFVKPVMEILAGIPDRGLRLFCGPHGGTIRSDGLGESPWASMWPPKVGTRRRHAVMGIMIIPFVSSLSDDAMNSAVPQIACATASLGLGATRAETITNRCWCRQRFPALSARLFAGHLSRAIGETMIVVMAAGLAANLTANPFEAVTTVTVQIVTLLGGRPGVRQRQDAGCLRPRVGALLSSPWCSTPSPSTSCASTEQHYE